MAIQFVNNIDFNLNQAESIVIEKLGSDPTSDLVVGRIIFNTVVDTLKQYVADAGSGSPGWIEVGGSSGVETFTNTSGTFVSFGTDNSSAVGDVSVGIIDLSATGTPSATTFLRGDNTWSTAVTSVGLSMPTAFTVTNSPVTGSGTLTVTGAGTTSQYVDGTGALQTFPTIPTVPSNIVETIDTTNGTYINLTPTTATDGDVTITADLNAADGTAAAGERYLTKTNKWATVASIPGTYTFNVTGDTGTPETIASGNTLDIAGGTNINTEVSATDTVTVNLDDSITLAGTLTVNGTGQSSFGGQVTVPTTPSAATDAASKSYVDSLVAGGLTFKDGFNAGTGAIDGGGNLTTGASRVAISVGDFYVVTTAGSFYGSVSLDVGDSVIAKEDAAQGTSDINDWVIVQGDEGVTTFSNSNGGTYVNYEITNSGAIGAVDIGNVDLTAVDGTSDTATRFLSKDNTWDVPSYTTNTDANYALTAAAKSGSNVPLTLTGSNGGSTTTVNLTEGANITLTRNSSGQITIASTDTGALGDRVALTGGSQAGGLTTFTYDVTNSFTGASAIDVKCEVISAAGETVYASVTRSGTNLIVEFTGSISDSAYEVLLTYVG